MQQRIGDLKELLKQGRITRRDFIARATFLGLSLGAMESIIAACAPSAPAPAPAAPTAPAAAATAPAAAPAPTKPAAVAETPETAGVKGGILRSVLGGEPPSLDMHWASASWTRDVGWHIYEALFTWDANYKLIPQLAESYEVSNDGLTHTIKLRKGVQFHNGKEMTVEDVESSLRRWATKSGRGKDLFNRVEDLGKPDKYTMVFKMKGPYAMFDLTFSLLAQGSAIYPKEVVDEAGTGQIKQFIGTGPYKFVEHQKDRLIKLARFANYANRGDKADGFGGKKHAFFDEIHFLPVPDQNVRVAGVQSGEYDYVDNINTDQYLLLKDSQQVRTVVVSPARQLHGYFNLQVPFLQDVKLRQAALAALDMEPILKAGWGTPEFYGVNPSLMWKQTPWYTESGKEFYNQKNAEKAKALLKESQYKGQPLRWITTKEFPWLYQETIVAGQMMKAAGINVEPVLMDWATVVNTSLKPEGWEMYGGSPTFVPHPILLSWNQPGSAPGAGYWDNKKAWGLRSVIAEKADFKEQFAAWEEMQRLTLEEAPFLRFGEARELLLTVPKLKGVTRGTTLQFWNAWFGK